jgi:hypothetical protein
MEEKVDMVSMSEALAISRPFVDRNEPFQLVGTSKECAPGFMNSFSTFGFRGEGAFNCCSDGSC